MAIYLNEAGQQKTVYSSKDGLYYDRQGNRLFAKPDNSLGTITSESLAPSATTNFETPAQTPTYPVETLTTPKLEMTPTENQAQSYTTRLQELNKQLLGESGVRAAEEEKQGLPELLKTQQDLTNRLNILKAEAQQIPLQMQQEATGRGITAAGLAPLESARTRTNTIAALGVSALLEASQGNITTAQTLVDRAVAQEFDPIKAEIDATTKNLNLILQSPQYSLDEKNRAQAQLDAQEAKKKQVEEEEANKKEIWSIASQAATAGADAVTLQSIQNAKTKEEAQNIAQRAGLFEAKPEEKALMQVSPGTSIYDPNTGAFVGTAPEKPAQPGDEVKVVGDSLLQYNEDNNSWDVVYTKPKGAASDDLSVNEKLNLAEKGYELDAQGNLVKSTATAQEKIDKSSKVLTAVNELLSKDWGKIVGNIGGRVPESLMSANSYDALTQFNNLKSLLTLDNMGIMKGVLSDSDIKILTQAATPLNRRMTPETFKSELEKIKNAAVSIKNSNILEMGQILDNGDGTYSYKNLDGTVHTGKNGDSYKDETIPKLDLDFSMVGGDTNKALPATASKAKVGSEGGQCGRFVNKATGLGLGDSYESKISKMDSSITKPEPGMVFVMPYKNTGHTGFILGVNGDKALVKDSNWGLDEIVRVHEIPLNKITGLRRV